MSQKLFKLDWGMEIAAFSGEGGTLVVDTAGQLFRIDIARGLAGHQVAFTGRVDSVRLELTRDSSPVCVTDLHIGLVKPRTGSG